MPRLITSATTFILIILFLYTATQKLMNLTAFQYAISKSPVIKSAATFISIAVPAIEVIVVAMLFFPKTRKAGLLASTTVMTIFTLYIGYMIATQDKLPCNCGGIINSLSWSQHLSLNIILTILSAFAYRLSSIKDVIAIHNRTSRKPVTE